MNSCNTQLCLQINPCLLYLSYKDYLVRILKPSQQRITLICFFSHTITFFGAYLSGHMVKNGMSYHTYTFPNPTNPFFFGSGERSGTKALYAKNGRNRLKGNKNHNFFANFFSFWSMYTTRYFQLLPIWQLHSRKKVLNILK